MDILYTLYRQYGEGVVERATPGPDGLFPVERRILLGVWKCAKDKFVKSGRVVGEIFGRWHPHSPESIYGTMAKLVRRGLINGQGNFGKIAVVDAPPAAMRYTEVKCVEWLKKLAFELIDYVPWKEIEGTESEPTVLPSPIPLLIGSGTAEGISYWKFTSLLFPVNELLQALISLLANKEMIPEPRFDGCRYEGDIRHFWENGQVKIKIIPHYTDHKEYIEVLGKLQNISTKRFDQAGIEYSDLSSRGQLQLRLYKKRGVDLKKFIPTWQVNTSLLMYYNGRMYVNIGLKQMMLFQYNNVYKPALESKLKHELRVLEDKITDYEIIAKIKKLIQKHPRIEESGLISRFSANQRERVSKILGKYPIRSLIRLKTETTTLKSQVKNVKQKLSNIDKTCFDHIKTSLLS